MNALLLQLRAAAAATLALLLLCGALYPLAVRALAQTLFPHEAAGSLLVDRSGVVRGSTLLSQPFTGPAYFHPRPSAAGAGHDAAASGGSNLGPTSQKLADLLKSRIQAYRTENGLGPSVAVPADAVTASGSGLDPHISPGNAALQAARVARARGLAIDDLLALVRQCTDQPAAGFLGHPGVNVPRLNFTLDQLPSTRE